MSQMSQESQSSGGNTSTPEPRSRKWIFTWNNYPTDWEDRIKAKFSMAKYLCKPERGENGTPHIQGRVEFSNASRFTTLKNAIPEAHWEIEKCTKKSIEYILKEETKDGEVFTNIKEYKPKPPVITEFRPWQDKLWTTLNTCQPDDRKIYWYVDSKGGAGKTKMCKHIIRARKDSIYLTGKAADMKYGIKQWLDDGKELKIVLIDLCRSQESYFSYEGLEAIKNGIFYNTKYECSMVEFDSPWIVVFANWEPEVSKLSEDRWAILTL